MNTTTKKHRATEPLPAEVRVSASGGAHRATRTPELLLAAGMATILVVVLAVLTTRG